jgi:LmbE family N-acetylglucosaminyl deacetylase
MGGILIKMVRQKCRIKVIYFSSDHSPSLYEEIRNVSNNAGFEYHCLGFQMRNFPQTISSYESLRDIIQEFNPEQIFLPFILDDHPDHTEVSKILMSLDLAQDYESRNIWAYQVYTCLPLNRVLNIGDVMEEKLNILRLYRSRFLPRDWAHFVRGLNAYNTRFLDKPNSTDYAEVFLNLPLRSYRAMCETYFQSKI